jgi:betaine-aldehyde dehydrogenase
MDQRYVMASQLSAHHWIDGEWVDSRARAESVNPATGEVIGTYTEAGEAEAKRAIEAALRAFRETDWRENRRLRAKVINEMADRFEARTDDLVKILSLENGKVEREARFEVEMVPSKLRFYAALALTDFGRAMETSPGRYTMTLRQPTGSRNPGAVEFPRGALHPIPGAGAGRRLHHREQASGIHGADQLTDV